MTTPIHLNQFQSLIESLNEVLSFVKPADAVLRQFFREQSKIGGHDRRYIVETVYGILRHAESLLPFAPIHASRRLALLFHMKIEGRSLRDLEKLCTSEELQWLKDVKASPVTPSLSTKTGLPEWIVNKLKDLYPEEELLALGRSMMFEAPLDIRVNTFLVSREEVLNELLSLGFNASITPHSPLGIRIQGRPSLQDLQLFKKGYFEIQDEGSQLLGLMLAPKRRDLIIDFCAGAGGKTLLLATLMHNHGRVYAFDVSSKRLDQLKPRLKRSGLSNIMPVLIESERDQRVKRLNGKADRVLVDAPCSGLGTLRRNPDLKYRQSAQGIDELVVKQRAILESAAHCVKPGGMLMYATCSILFEENEDQVKWFSEKHPDFVLTNNEQLELGLSGEQYLKCLPHKHGTDGFFAAIWQRKVS
ncbi:RsmB/NOP family class I SAM-dependent RNA methyltransferase [Ferrovum sp. PN-J185]|uniref:RsmB/NOP family class I SAM-dependent RNA methyltransferase n=1 Tax=Ferrovum sp. PN-J185 TaxID=1356306 RepID=UPI000792FA79|nr:RsmB/NOP family class I SAM-dependent RNA methyltransferase [Ferrovum sp. PN-J185]KXW56383.1 ribosomal RNA small subunit methyltransferase B [Ferrovum sp. PN-J185]MCC6069106.1 RsmB/NOP family class I SAM-dependent RNA methyltransferase [Ferrovum sp. PN-J185]